jgi:hypothetical protein
VEPTPARVALEAALVSLETEHDAHDLTDDAIRELDWTVKALESEDVPLTAGLEWLSLWASAGWRSPNRNTHEAPRRSACSRDPADHPDVAEHDELRFDSRHRQGRRLSDDVGRVRRRLAALVRTTSKR